MKKLMTLALVALTAAAAQALTIDWATVANTVDSGYTSATIEQTATQKANETAVGGTLSSEVNWTAQATITFNTAVSGQTLFCSVGSYDTVTFYWARQGVIKAFSASYAGMLTDENGNTTDGRVSSSAPAANTTLTITYSWEASTNTLSVYLGEDMTLLASSVISDTTTDHDRNSNVESDVIVDNFQFVVGAAELETSTNYDATLQGQNLDMTTEAYVVEANVLVGYTAEEAATLVPEPTCLALLALGVAGLALRRRA